MNATPNCVHPLKRPAGMVVSHALFLHVLNLAIECVERSYRPEPPGLMIVGLSGSGKTTIARALERHYEPSCTAEGSFLPVLYVETPANPTIKSLAETILLALGYRITARMTTAQLTQEILRWLKARGVRVLVIDEVQHFAQRKPEQVQITSDYFKSLINHAELPIILMGLKSAEQLLDVNEQLRRRFTSKVEMSRFLYGTPDEQTTFRNFLRSAEGGLKFSFGATSPDIAQRVHWATAGLPSHVMNLVLGAAEIMLKEGRTEITPEDLGKSFTRHLWELGSGHLNPFSHDFVGRDLVLAGEPFNYLLLEGRAVRRAA